LSTPEAVSEVGGRATAYRATLPSSESNPSAIFDISHKETQRALCMLDGVVDVTHDYRGGVFLMSAVPARSFASRSPGTHAFAAITDGQLIRREDAGDVGARRVELVLKPPFQLSQKLQLALPWHRLCWGARAKRSRRFFTGAGYRQIFASGSGHSDKGTPRLSGASSCLGGLVQETDEESP
jgi:hypothetical protein